MKRVFKMGILLAMTVSIAMNSCSEKDEEDKVGTGYGQIEFQGDTYHLDASNMYILLNEGYPPLHQINLWSKGQRRSFLIVLKSTSEKELQAGIYVGEDIESFQFSWFEGLIGFYDKSFDSQIEIYKNGKTFDIVFTANTLVEGEQLLECVVTWSGTLPIAAKRRF